MRKSVVLIVISVLFQSCFSYKAVENKSSEYQVGKFYKIKQKEEYEKVKIISTNDSILVVNHNFEEKEVAIKTITKVKKRKFSYFKTLILPPVTFIAIIAIAASSIQVKTGRIQSPP